MKKIWTYLSQYLKEDFSISYYSCIGIFLSLIVFANYRFDFEDTVLESFTGKQKLLVYFLFYSAGYYCSLLMLIIFLPHLRFFRTKYFWIYSTFGLALLALDSSMPFLSEIVYRNTASSVSYWAYKVAVNGISFFTVLLPLYIFYLFNDRSERNFYGLSQERTDLRPYWYLLLLMLPLLLSASFLESFQRQYPMYKSNMAYLTLGVPEWVTVLCYELAYGLDFITVELLFRGFFVIGMIKILGRHAIVPMAVIYCMLHFGKPAGEAISSIFGGYILGVIAYRTKSIWGGIIVHMGIAWLMEVIAYLSKQ